VGLFVEHVRNTALYRRLIALPSSEHGNLLHRTDDTIAEAQTEFLRWAIASARPDKVLETGTCNGMFGCFLCALPVQVELHTFDSDPRGAAAVQEINRSGSGVRAEFHCGDSRETLWGLAGDFGFAWVDGGHEDDIPMSDLLNCHRLRIPWLAVDDTVIPTVRRAVEYLTAHVPYREVPNPFAYCDRRRAVLLRREDK